MPVVLQSPQRLVLKSNTPMTTEEDLDHLREEIAQMQRELTMERVSTSVTAQDLIQFTRDNVSKDYLRTKQCEPGANPWEESEKSCCGLM